MTTLLSRGAGPVAYSHYPVYTNSARIGQILAGRQPHFSYSMPADPIITREVVVTSAAQFNAEAQISGTRIIINNSFTGNLQVQADDIDVVMSNSAVLSGRVLFHGGFFVPPTQWWVNRVRWTGGNVGNLYSAMCSDLMIDDVYANAVDAYALEAYGENYFGYQQPSERIAIINSTLQRTGEDGAPDNTYTWALHTHMENAGSDFIIGNVRIVSNQQTMRLIAMNNVLFFDSVLNPTLTSNNAGRVHQSSTNVWFKDGWGAGQFGLSINAQNVETTPQVLNGLWDSFDWYFNQYFNSAFITSNTGELRNSTLHGGTISYPTGISDGGGNVSTSWDGSTLPDFSGIGAIR